MKLLFSTTFIVLLFLCYNAKAQMTILNVPSADVTPKGKYFLSHESQFRTKERGRFYNATHYFAASFFENTEFNLTYFNLGDATKDQDTLATGFKSAIPIKSISQVKKYQPTLIIGSNILSTLHHESYGNWSYLGLAITIPQSKTRITSLITYGTKEMFGHDATRFAGGIEQEITSKLSFIADWYSGNANAFGVLAYALSYKLGHDLSVASGLQFSNSKRIGQNGFVFSLAKIF